MGWELREVSEMGETYTYGEKEECRDPVNEIAWVRVFTG